MQKFICLLSITAAMLPAATVTAEHRPAATHEPTLEAQPVSYFQTPFEPGGENGELIFVTVRLNGEEVPFVLDTGAPTVILNTAHFPENEDGSANGAAYGVSGPVEMRSINIESFDWHGLRLHNTALIGLDLSHLETATGSEIVGLIGFDTVQDFELLIDYEAKQLTLFRPGAANFHGGIRPEATIPFTLEAHIPVVDASIGGKAMRLGIDTGAGVNLLDKPSFERLDATADYVAKATDVLHGADKNETTVPLIEVEATRVDTVELDSMVYSVADISHLNSGYGLQIGGLLGYPFLSQHKTSINFADEKIHLWDAEAEIEASVR
ncbi:MAG: retroviral-like aspartic protease family protein [Acidobacteriota bacterium]